MSRQPCREDVSFGRCRVCDSATTGELFDFGRQPRCAVVEPPDLQRHRPRRLRLAWCPDCGYAFLPTRTDADDFYRDEYWPTSRTPPDHARALAARLSSLCRLEASDLVLDVGSNDGYLLEIFRDLGARALLGVEPSAQCCERSERRGIATLRGFFDAGLAESIRAAHPAPRLLLCRHVIEHVPNPRDFLAGLRMLMDADSLLALECPSFEMTAAKGDVSSIWEEHVSYFTRVSLGRLLEQVGLRIERHEYIEHGGGSLLLFVRAGRRECAGRAGRGDLDTAPRFARRARANVALARQRFAELARNGSGLAAWGAGPRGLALLNLTGTAGHVDHLVDDSPEKRGRRAPGSGLRVISGDEMLTLAPAHCLVLPLRSKAIEHAVAARHPRYTAAGGRFIELYPGDPWRAPLLADAAPERGARPRRPRPAASRT